MMMIKSLSSHPTSSTQDWDLSSELTQCTYLPIILKLNRQQSKFEVMCPVTEPTTRCLAEEHAKALMIGFK